MTEQPCPFCEIVAGRAPATIVRDWPDAIAIVPLGPVVEGHVLVIPREHVPDFVASPKVSAATMECAAELATGMGSYNLINDPAREAIRRARGDEWAPQTPITFGPCNEEPDGGEQR